jgi:hypothetical protein
VGAGSVIAGPAGGACRGAVARRGPVLWQPMEHVLCQCLTALRLPDHAGLDDRDRMAVNYTALLVNFGWHAYAHEQAKSFGDDIALESGSMSTSCAASAGTCHHAAGRGRQPAAAPLGEIAVQRRERLDASGCPRGLSGAAIARRPWSSEPPTHTSQCASPGRTGRPDRSRKPPRKSAPSPGRPRPIKRSSTACFPRRRSPQPQHHDSWGRHVMQLAREPEPLLKCLQARDEHAVAYRRAHLVLVRLVAIEP